MGFKLKVRSIYQTIKNKNSTSKLLKLNDCKVENTLFYEAVLNEISDIFSHLEVLNNQVNKFNALFKNKENIIYQKDLNVCIKLAIANDEPFAEHIYFLETKDNGLFIVRQFYQKVKRKSFFSKEHKYDLQQIIYRVNGRSFTLFECSNKNKLISNAVEKSKNHKDSDLDSESEQKSEKESEKESEAENSESPESENEESENIHDVEESSKLLTELSKSKLNDIPESSENEKSEVSQN